MATALGPFPQLGQGRDVGTARVEESSLLFRTERSWLTRVEMFLLIRVLKFAASGTKFPVTIAYCWAVIFTRLSFKPATRVTVELTSSFRFATSCSRSAPISLWRGP